MHSPRLSDAEVKSRLESYENESVTEELYGFGKMLVQDAVGRLSAADAKASSVAAYCGGLLTVMSATFSIWTRGMTWREVFLPVASAAFAIAAGYLAFSATGFTTVDWFSADDWLKKEAIQDPQRIRKFHILSMWVVLESHDSAYQDKLARIKRARWLTALSILSILCLAGTFIESAWRLATF
jgi:hypothetical protein